MPQGREDARTDGQVEMRILITSDIFPPDAGGPASYVPALATELSRRGHTVHVLTYSIVAEWAGDASYPFSVERIVVGGSRLSRLRKTASRIASYAAHADVLYINGLLMESAPLIALTHKPAVAKVVGDIAWERARDKGWTSDEFEPFQSRRYGLGIELRRALRRWVLQRMKAIIVPSAYLKGVVTHWGLSPDRIRVVYNAFEPATGDAHPARVSLDAPTRLVTVCRLMAWKGVAGLIQTVADLPDVGLLIVGDGPERAALHTLASQLGVADRVHFAGQVPRDDVGGYLHACHIFALNSRYEGLPHVLLEAMAVGLPVIAADAGGCREVVQHGENGLLVLPGDTEALRQAIRFLADNPSECQRLVRGSQATLSRFSRQSMMDQTETVLTAAARQA